MGKRGGGRLGRRKGRAMEIEMCGREREEGRGRGKAKKGTRGGGGERSNDPSLPFHDDSRGLHGEVLPP